jgi:two-component system cell cycle sensor histidine kinase/response regulator CckA
MRLKTRLQLNSIMILTLVLLMLLSLAWSLREASQAGRDAALVAEMQKTAFERTVLRDEYLLNQEDRARTQWYAKTEEFTRLLQAAGERFTQTPDKALLEAMQQDFNGTVSIFSRLQELRATGKNVGAGALPALEGEKRLIGQILIRAYALTDGIAKLRESAQRTATAAHQRSILLAVMFMGVAMLATIANSAVINSILTKRLAGLLEGSAIIGSGNLEHRIHIKGGDELGDLARANNEMAAKLKESHTSVENLYQEIAERQRAEGALQDSEKRYRRLFESAKDGILILDADSGQVVDVNPFLTELLGYSCEALCGKRLWDIGLFKDIAASQEAFKTLQEKEYVRYEDLPLETRDGRRIAVEFVSNVYLVDRRKVIQCNIRDITERKRAEKALRESEEQVRFLGEILERASQPFAVGHPDGRLGIFNTAFCELTGYGADELRALDWGKDLTPAEWREPEAQALEELERTGKAVRYEKEYIRKNGARLPIEMLVHAVRATSGKVQFYYAFVTDISERKRLQQELRKLSMAVEQSPASVEITDFAGNIEYVNPKFTRITGYTLEEVRGRNPRILKSGQTSAEEYRELWNTITAGGEWHGELHNKKKDGAHFWERVSISPLRDASGAITHFIAIKEDITAQKVLEDQFRQAQKLEAVGRLAGGVAHDFNNMLGIVIGYAELARDRISPNDPLHGDLGEILRAAQRSTGLVRQLLAFARRQTVEPRVLDLNGIIAESEKMLRRLVGEDIGIHFTPGTDLWQIKIDPAQIDQILANLTVNARDAIPGVGNINIETQNVVLDEAYCAGHSGFSPGEYVMAAFSDSGTGMAKDVLEHIFEPFFTTKEPGKGTGLGLATIYGIVKQNNGFINVYSEPGQGTTFKIYLPRHQGPAEDKERRTASVSPGGAETILVVEDDRQILTLAQKILEKQGYTVIPAALPGEALVLCEKHPGDIHLLITDVVMPAMNGKELKERIEKRKPGIKVLYMSGYTANIIAHRGVLAEGVQFIQKPFSVDSLARKVREVLD